MDIVVLVLIGPAAGTVGSLLGLGGGILVVPALILLRNVNPTLATGTSVAVILPTMAVAVWRRGVQGHVDWGLAALLAVGAIGGAFLGSWLAGQLPPSTIRRIFAVLLAATAVALYLKK